MAKSDKGNNMVNLYQLLGVSVDADAATIVFAISQCRLQGDINPQILDKAEEWLLKPEVRAQYDAQLRQHDAAFFSQAAPTQAVDSFTPPAAPVGQASTSSNEPEAHYHPHADRVQATGKKTFKTKAEPKHNIRFKQSGKKSDGRGCLIAFLIILALILVLIGVVSWWGYSIYQDTKQTLNEFEIEDMQTTPGWHVYDSGDGNLVYAVAQNQPHMVLMLVGENAQPMLANRDKDRIVLCHSEEDFLCNIKVQFDNDPPKIFESGQMGKQILVTNDADKAQMALRLQDTEKLNITLIDNADKPTFEFQLGAFPSDTMVREPRPASDIDAQTQAIDEKLRQIEADVAAAEKQANEAVKQANEAQKASP